MPTLVAFIPHPDDESYAFGGLLALAARAGWACHVECASSGENGKRHDGGVAGCEELAEAREAELEASCRILGGQRPAFWRLPDGRLREMPSQAGRVAEAIDRLGPDVVLTLGPDGAYGHPDHIVLYRWVAEAQRAGGQGSLVLPVFVPGLFLPQYEKCISMMGNPPEPRRETIGGAEFDFEVDIRQARDVKLAVIAAHRTQLPGGDPRAIFPAGIVDALLEVERYSIVGPTESALALFGSLAGEITSRLH